MSSDAIAKLPPPLRDLVAASVTDGSVGSGTKPEADEWIEKVASGQVGKPESLKVQIRRLLGVDASDGFCLDFRTLTLS